MTRYGAMRIATGERHSTSPSVRSSRLRLFPGDVRRLRIELIVVQRRALAASSEVIAGSETHYHKGCNAGGDRKCTTRPTPCLAQGFPLRRRDLAPVSP
jgi:hypothetical protein